jgi:hypothetical protein
MGTQPFEVAAPWLMLSKDFASHSIDLFSAQRPYLDSERKTFITIVFSLLGAIGTSMPTLGQYFLSPASSRHKII